MLFFSASYIHTGGKSHGSPDGGFLVPTLLRWPGVIQPNTRILEPVSQMDIFPTVSHTIGATLPTDLVLDGKNIEGLVSGREQISQHEFLMHYCHDTVHAVRYRPRTGTGKFS